MESDETPVAVPVPFAMPCGANMEPADFVHGSNDDPANEASKATENAAATERRPSLQLPALSSVGAEITEPPLPEPTMAESPTLPRGMPCREVTPFAIRAAVRDTLAATSLQNSALAPAGPSVRASADSTTAMAAILRQFTAHLRNQPAPARCSCERLAMVVHTQRDCMEVCPPISPCPAERDDQLFC